MVVHHPGKVGPTHTSSESCALHRVHWPKPLYSELHHIIPQAWQVFWRPTPVERSTQASSLFDPRTIPLCPTVHRNVHTWLVKLMRSGPGEDPLAAKLAVFGSKALTREQRVAYQALCRWKEWGGSLDALRSARLYGEG